MTVGPDPWPPKSGEHSRREREGRGSASLPGWCWRGAGVRGARGRSNGLWYRPGAGPGGGSVALPGAEMGWHRSGLWGHVLVRSNRTPGSLVVEAHQGMRSASPQGPHARLPPDGSSPSCRPVGPVSARCCNKQHRPGGLNRGPPVRTPLQTASAWPQGHGHPVRMLPGFRTATT